MSSNTPGSWTPVASTGAPAAVHTTPKVHINWSQKDSKPNKAWLKSRCRIQLRQMILYLLKGQSSYHRWQPMLIETWPISWHWNLQVIADNDTLPNGEIFSTPAKGGRNESEDFNGVVVRTKNWNPTFLFKAMPNSCLVVKWHPGFWTIHWNRWT